MVTGAIGVGGVVSGRPDPAQHRRCSYEDDWVGHRQGTAARAVTAEIGMLTVDSLLGPAVVIWCGVG